MTSTEYSFVISIPNFWRMSDDEWETIEPEHIDFWSKEACQLTKRKFVHDGCDVAVVVDWRPIARYLKKNFEVMQPVREGRALNDDWYKKISRPIRISAKVFIEGRNNTSAYEWYPSFFLEAYIYEIFAIINLSLPGAAEFNSLTIQDKKSKTSITPKLFAYNFDFSLVKTHQGGWPSLRRIPLHKVLHWFSALQIGVKQKADTGTERAIFVLYHLCKLDGGIESIIWIFHGLEALFGTRIGENISGLVRRISSLLGCDAKQKANLNKRLRELYDLRSSFVHGNYGIHHPMSSEVVDRRLDDDVTKIYLAGDFGFAILVASLQAMIDADIAELTYEERLLGKRISP